MTIDPHRYQDELDRAFGLGPDDRRTLAQGRLGASHARALADERRREVRAPVATLASGAVVIVVGFGFFTLQIGRLDPALALFALGTLALFVFGTAVTLVNLRTSLRAIEVGQVFHSAGPLEKHYIAPAKTRNERFLVRVRGTSEWFDVPGPVFQGVAAGLPHGLHLVTGFPRVVAMDLLDVVPR